MTNTANVAINLDVAFEPAGVGFSIAIQPGSGADGAALHIGLKATESGKTATFTQDCSYALADFVGGFCRWLGTKRVTVSHTDQEIHGHFHPQYSASQLLGTTQEMCQMLEDKFGSYPHSILK